MKLIFIYGPPAAGKLTVAKELSKITKYKVFHNQLLVDLLVSVFDFGTKDYKKYRKRIMLDLLKDAAKSKLKGLIITFVYAKKEDDKVVKQIMNTVEKNRGKVLFVHLYCHKEELKKRVKNKSRKFYKKIKTLKVLNHVLNKYELFHQVPHRKSLIIDNTNIPAKKVARMIKKHYKL